MAKINLEKRAERDAERGIGRCGVLNGIGNPCQAVVSPGGMCFRHDPARVAERDEYERIAYEKAVTEVVHRKAEIERGIANLEARQRAMHLNTEKLFHSLEAERRDLERRVASARAELLRLENDVRQAQSNVVAAAGELLTRAKLYIAQMSNGMSEQACDLAIRCAEALTNHSRERRLLSLHGESRQKRSDTPITDMARGAAPKPEPLDA